jgi:hypothetical protein
MTDRRYSLVLLAIAAAILLPIGAANLYTRLGSFWPASDIRTNRLAPAYRAPTNGESMIYWKYRYLLTEPERWRADIVVYGDSSAMISVDQRVIEKETGRPTVNIGFDGSYSLDFNQHILEFYVRRVAQPKIAILHLSAPVNIGLSDIQSASTQARTERRRSEALRWTATVTNGYPAIYKAGIDFSLSGLRRHLFGDPDAVPFQFDSDAKFAETIRDTKGFVPYPGHLQELPPQSFVPVLSRYNRRQLERIFAFSKANGIELYLFINPLPESLNVPETIAGFESFTEQLKAVASPYKNVRIADPRRFYPNEIANNGAHMVGDGPVRNAADIAGYLLSNNGRKPGS